MVGPKTGASRSCLCLTEKLEARGAARPESMEEKIRERYASCGCDNGSIGVGRM